MPARTTARVPDGGDDQGTVLGFHRAEADGDWELGAVGAGDHHGIRRGIQQRTEVGFATGRAGLHRRPPGAGAAAANSGERRLPRRRQRQQGAGGHSTPGNAPGFHLSWNKSSPGRAPGLADDEACKQSAEGRSLR